MHYQPVALLSGGEKRRLMLLTVLLRNPNFLILDEPTNDMDIMTLQSIEEFIQQYKGCLIVVSHDRYFMDEVVDQLLVFEGDGKIKGFTGNYSDYRNFLDEAAALEKQTERPAQIPRFVSETIVSKKRSFREQKEFEQLDIDIQQLEEEKNQLQKEMNGDATDYVTLERLSARIKEILNRIDEKTNRWIELDEIGS
jgi:ABC transport system ATP-binding/permease protein